MTSPPLAPRVPPPSRRWPRGLAVACALALAGCASGPAQPDWERQAASAAERALAAQLQGRMRVQAQEWERARTEVARTGRPDALARLELLHCAARVASLAPPACPAFETLRADAAPAERAYADYLAGQAVPAQWPLLPAAQQPVAALLGNAAAVGAPAAGRTAPEAVLQALDDPLSRLVAAAVLLQQGQGTPGVIGQAIDTASAQGWAVPLRAWLGVLRQRAQAAGDAEAAAAVQRRIDLVERSLGAR